MTKVPWPDNTFDLVFATQVFEHVSDQELAYSEVHRVLKPEVHSSTSFRRDGVRLKRISTSPFGGVLTSRRYHRLCAALGIRGLNQEHCTADQVVELNRRFVTQGVNYLSGREIAALLDRIFGEFEYVEDAFIRHSRGDRGIWRCRSDFFPLYASCSALRIPE
jgi:SAM-dependent methyltransferase